VSLSTEGLLFRHPGFRLGPLDFTQRSGRLVVIGPSGSGKTTFLRLCAGLERPEEGRILFDGRELSGPSTFVPPARRNIGFVFQGLALWPHMRVREQIRFAARCSIETAEAWLDRVGLHGFGKRLPGELSGGEAQRVALARALAARPRLLLLDEPLRSVDPHRRADLQALIRDLCRELDIPMLAVTHDPEEALGLGDEICVLEDGRIRVQDGAAEICRNPRSAFAASFLLGASLLPLESRDGKVHSPFGSWPAPNGSGRVFLALLPGDLEPAGEGPIATVRDRREGLRGPVLEVELSGVRLLVPARDEERPATVALRLRGTPRLVTGGDGG